MPIDIDPKIREEIEACERSLLRIAHDLFPEDFLKNEEDDGALFMETEAMKMLEVLAVLEEAERQWRKLKIEAGKQEVHEAAFFDLFHIACTAMYARFFSIDLNGENVPHPYARVANLCLVPAIAAVTLSAYENLESTLDCDIPYVRNSRTIARLLKRKIGDRREHRQRAEDS